MKISSENQLGILMYNNCSYIKDTISLLRNDTDLDNAGFAIFSQLLIDHETEFEISLNKQMADENLNTISFISSNNYIPTDTAKRAVSLIPIEEGQFDFKLFEDLPNEKITFCLGANESIRILKFGSGIAFHHIRKEGINSPFDFPCKSNIIPFNQPETAFELMKDIRFPYLKLAIQLLLYVKKTKPVFKYMKPGEKIGTKKTGNHINCTSQRVIIVDSAWNTVTKTTTGFEVRGHWRYQWVGKGRQFQLPIFIQEFMKDGYTRNGHRLDEIKNEQSI